MLERRGVDFFFFFFTRADISQQVKKSSETFFPSLPHLSAASVSCEVLQKASSGSDLDHSKMMILQPSSGQHSQRCFSYFLHCSDTWLKCSALSSK